MMPGVSALAKRVFVKHPAELRGEVFTTRLLKGERGLGFTIIGGDNPDEEFLQIKNVVRNGPAFVDGKLQTGRHGNNTKLFRSLILFLNIVNILILKYSGTTSSIDQILVLQNCHRVKWIEGRLAVTCIHGKRVSV